MLNPGAFTLLVNWIVFNVYSPTSSTFCSCGSCVMLLPIARLEPPPGIGAAAALTLLPLPPPPSPIVPSKSPSLLSAGTLCVIPLVCCRSAVV